VPTSANCRTEPGSTQGDRGEGARHGLTMTAYLCMVDRMEKRKATFLLSAHTLDAAKTVAQGGNMSAFVDRALRNETLRAQLATSALPELSGWLDDAETEQAPAA
jgi:hypothetical protein